MALSDGRMESVKAYIEVIKPYLNLEHIEIIHRDNAEMKTGYADILIPPGTKTGYMRVSNELFEESTDRIGRTLIHELTHLIIENSWQVVEHDIYDLLVLYVGKPVADLAYNSFRRNTELVVADLTSVFIKYLPKFNHFGKYNNELIEEDSEVSEAIDVISDFIEDVHDAILEKESIKIKSEIRDNDELFKHYEIWCQKREIENKKFANFLDYLGYRTYLIHCIDVGLPWLDYDEYTVMITPVNLDTAINLDDIPQSCYDFNMPDEIERMKKIDQELRVDPVLDKEREAVWSDYARWRRDQSALNNHDVSFDAYRYSRIDRVLDTVPPVKLDISDEMIARIETANQELDAFHKRNK